MKRFENKTTVISEGAGGIGEVLFKELVKKAKENCPVFQVLSSLKLSLETTFKN